MKPFRERNLTVIGSVGIVVMVTLVGVAYNYNKLPFVHSRNTYSALFEEAGGLNPDAPVQVSGYRAGQVQSISLTPNGVLVEFAVNDEIRLGDRTEAAIKTQSLLGNKVVEINPRGDGTLTGTIPLDRTSSPYQLPDAIGDLSATISGLDTTQLSDSLATLSDTLHDTPPQLKAAVDGVARFSATINQRDSQLRQLLGNASKATTVLAQRTDEIVQLIRDTNSLLAQLRTQSAALDELSGNITALSQQIKGFIADNRTTLKPTLDKLNGVLTIVDNHKTQVQQSIKGFGDYALSLGESLASGPFFKAYLSNLLPGQFVQPFVDAAFSDLGLDPNVLAPSELTDPQVGQPGLPPLPIPYPRTGQGGEPRRTLPDAITGNPADPRYPYREPLPAPPSGGPPPGPPAPAPANDPAATAIPPVYVTAPDEAPPLAPPSQPAGVRAMMNRRIARLGLLVILLVSAFLGGGWLTWQAASTAHRTHITAYFENSNGVFVGDDVRIRGVNVGKITAIEPQPTQVKISLWIDDQYAVPATANAVILSPTLVSARAIQLTPPYHGGASLQDDATIPRNRTAVPVEFDDFREQLERLTRTLQPTEPGGVSTLGAFVNTVADNLRGQGPAIRDAIIKLSQTISAVGDHSKDTFKSVKDLATLVSALEGSTDLIRQLNQNLASVSGQLSNDPAEIANAITSLNDAVGEVTAFVKDNRESLGTTSDKLTSVSQALVDSLGDIKQALHVAPNTLANLTNVYQPAQGSYTGTLAVNNFSNPISFLCGAIEAASRLNAEQSSKLCVQYLAPIIKNRQYNFLPFGLNPFVGASARPNEVTYSEDRMRPDYQPSPPPSPATASAPGEPSAPAAPPGPASDPDVAAPAAPTDPAAGLPGMMLPAEAGPR